MDTLTAPWVPVPPWGAWDPRAIGLEAKPRGQGQECEGQLHVSTCNVSKHLGTCHFSKFYIPVPTKKDTHVPCSNAIENIRF